MNDFNEKKLSINEINERSNNYAKPIITHYGDILLFKTKTLHGTNINHSNEARISFDFRIAFSKISIDSWNT